MILARQSFEPARPEDDAAIRALLRRTPMRGKVSLSLEREPRFELGASIESERSHVFVVRDLATGDALGLAQRTVSRAWIDGRPQLLGYLSHLRRDPRLAPTRGIAAAGFAACMATREEDELPFDLTSILEDNLPARRLLERGLPGLPRYERACRFLSFTIDVRAARRRLRRSALDAGLELRRATREDADAIAELLQRTLARHPLAPVWTARALGSSLAARNLELEHFRVALRGGRLIGCLALWDQRPFKQVVVRSYPTSLALARIALQPLRALVSAARIPAVGEALRLAYLSHAGVLDDDPRVLVALASEHLRSREADELEYAVLGCADDSGFAPAIRSAFRPRELASLLYLVHPPDSAVALQALGPGCPHVEVALL